MVPTEGRMRRLCCDMVIGGPIKVAFFFAVVDAKLREVLFFIQICQRLGQDKDKTQMVLTI